jgi:2-dehydro-3-deoxygluconokinase
MGNNTRLAAIGECMLEVMEKAPGEARFGFGGDTLNTAAYLARIGVPVDYITALGDDPYSARMIAAWQKEGIGTAYVQRISGELPGLYTIRVNAEGERQFHYWRSLAPAKRMFSFPDSATVLDALAGYPWIYLSGITLMVLNPPDRERLIARLQQCQLAGCRIVFDSNYRARGWSSAAEAAAVMQQVVSLSHIYLPGMDDARALYGVDTVQAVFERFANVPELIVKDGQRGCTIRSEAGLQHIAASAVERVVDSTAAGDSFNAAYIAQRMLGAEAIVAARFACDLAAIVVQNHGAIIDRPPMSAFLGALRHAFTP